MALPNLVQIKQALDKMMPELSPVPIGSIAYAHEVPTGWLECNGAAVSRTKYARLFKKIGTKYGAGDGSTTFNLPNLHHRVLEGTNTTNEVAKYQEAGLPDIVGSFGDFSARPQVEASGTGAFSLSKTGAWGYNGQEVLISVHNASLKASRSNAIYGKSDTSRMASLRLMAIIKS